MNLTDNLVKMGYLKTPRIIVAFKAVKRADFLPWASAGSRTELEMLAEIDTALPIGWGQTISQPAVVAFMLELLQPGAGDRILDVGSGSGWTSALLSHIVSQGPGGKVVAIERIKELRDFGENNVLKYNFISRGVAEFVCGDASSGYERQAPYDRILASAAAEALPQAWLAQLKPGGRLVFPLKNSIYLATKDRDGGLNSIEYPGFVFVPLIKEDDRTGND